MTFITNEGGTAITNANPGPALYAFIETAMLADGWTLEDTVVTATMTHKIMKSGSAGNAQSKDFYLDLNYPTTGVTGGFKVAPFEGYTAASDVGLRGPYTASNTTIDATTYSRWGATTATLESANWLNAPANTTLALALSTTAFTYWISVTRNRIIILLSNVPGSMLYSGFFTPSAAHVANAGAALFPLIVGVLSVSTSVSTSNSSSPLAVTRVPKATTISWGTSAVVNLTNLLNAGLGAGSAGSGVSEFTGELNIIPAAVSFGTGTTNAFVGELDGLGVAFANASVIRGDIQPVGADNWRVTSPTSNQVLLMKAV